MIKAPNFAHLTQKGHGKRIRYSAIEFFLFFHIFMKNSPKMSNKITFFAIIQFFFQLNYRTERRDNVCYSFTLLADDECAICITKYLCVAW